MYLPAAAICAQSLSQFDRGRRRKQRKNGGQFATIALVSRLSTTSQVGQLHRFPGAAAKRERAKCDPVSENDQLGLLGAK